jgi:isoaspartyl peptidase/L-asparaginase-like protein (Ntn-hydrolase superfamily)
MDSMSGRYALLLHGGAGTLADRDYAHEIEHMRGLAEAAKARLAIGANALDIVQDIVRELESSGLYVAGGPRPTRLAAMNWTPPSWMARPSGPDRSPP